MASCSESARAVEACWMCSQVFCVRRRVASQAWQEFVRTRLQRATEDLNAVADCSTTDDQRVVMVAEVAETASFHSVLKVWIDEL